MYLHILSRLESRNCCVEQTTKLQRRRDIRKQRDASLKPAVWYLIYNNIMARSATTMAEGRNSGWETKRAATTERSNRREFARARNPPLSLRGGLKINATTRPLASRRPHLRRFSRDFMLVSSLSFLAASLPPPIPLPPPPFYRCLRGATAPMDR